MKKKFFYFCTAFLSGVSVMAIELGAQRLLAPYFSSSQIVWTIVIGTIMIAMAVGNVLGGKMADKYKSPSRLFVLLFITATWVMLIPLLGKFIIAFIALTLATFVTKGYLIWASLISCLVVFAFPLMALGTVTPNLVKFAVDNTEESGKTVGVIEACNTVGSIIGTFLPTFVTIPTVGTSLTFVIFATILYAVCIVYFILKKLNRVRNGIIAVVCLVIGIISSNIGVAFWQSGLLYEGESVYNYLRVEETDSDIILSTNVLFGVQSIKSKNGGLTGMYYDYALSAPVIAGAPEKDISVCVLGLGTGTFATECVDFLNVNKIDGVEIDGKIIGLASEYFDLPSCVKTYEEDGRSYIDRTKNKYDTIMVDAYRDITIPFQMSSIEFFKSVNDSLNEGGVMVVNMNMFMDDDGGINDYLIGTVCEVFDNVYIANLGDNCEMFACNGFDLKERLYANVSKVSNVRLKQLLLNSYSKMKKCEKSGLYFTDDIAPVEVMGMSVIDKIIEEELTEVKSQIKGKSILELIKMLKEYI